MNFSPQATVAVVVPVHNGIDHLPRTLDVLNSMDWPEAVVVVVDDGSSDGTGEFLKSRPEVVVVPGSGDLWWSGGVDVGCRVAIERGADTLILWNDDNVSASRNCVTELVRFVRHVGGCAVPVVLEEGREGTLRIVSAGGDVDWARGGIPLRGNGAVYDRTRAQGEVRCEWLPGSALSFGKALFLELDGFDVRRFPQYRGDADFTLRATAHGAPCAALFSCWVVSDQSRTGMNFRRRVSVRQFVGGLFSLKTVYHLGSTVRFYARHCPRRYLVISLGMFYAKYVYATLKTWRPAARR